MLYIVPFLYFYISYPFEALERYISLLYHRDHCLFRIYFATSRLPNILTSTRNASVKICTQYCINNHLLLFKEFMIIRRWCEISMRSLQCKNFSSDAFRGVMIVNATYVLGKSQYYVDRSGCIETLESKLNWNDN